jgi:hypothetical protein
MRVTGESHCNKRTVLFHQNRSGYQASKMYGNANTDLASDTGEHISNEKNELEYIPFPICNETGKPLDLQYGVEEGMDMINKLPSAEVMIAN